MPDQTPEPLHEDDLRDIAERADSQSCDTVQGIAHELLAARARHLRALSLIHHLMRSRRTWQAQADVEADDASTFRAVAVLRGVDKEIAQQWAAWFAAEKDYWRERTAMGFQPWGRRVSELEADMLDARSWARHGYEIGQRSCAWSDQGVAPAWLTEGHAPESLEPTEDQRRMFGLDEENARLRARITELEADVERVWSESEAGKKLYEARGDRLVARIRELEADNARLRKIVKAAEEQMVLYRADGYAPIVGTDTGTRPAAQSEPVGYVVARSDENGEFCWPTVWESPEQATAGEGIAAGYEDRPGVTFRLYELREVRDA